MIATLSELVYTSKNKLLLIKDIQDITKTYLKDDRSYRYIYRKHIEPTYHISWSTYYNYISVTGVNDKLNNIGVHKATT